MTNEERHGDCAVCQQRNAVEPPVCGVCRSRVAGQLRDIPELVDELRGEPLPDVTTVGRRTTERADHLVDVDGALAAVVEVRREVLHEVVAGAIAGQSNAPRVQGSREAPVPIRVDVVDLLGPADERTVHDPLGDQVGHLSAATILDGWCRLFAEERRESTPTPHVTTQSAWLLDRLDELFKHPAVDEAAKEIGDLWHVLRRAAGLTMPRPELVEGVPCRSIECDLKTLYRVPGSEFVECSSCGTLVTEGELQEWIKMLRAPLCGKRKGDWWCARAKRHAGRCVPSAMALAAAGIDRPDVVYPHHLYRDEAGRVLGADQFARIVR
jgi:hypothetical protein